MIFQLRVYHFRFRALESVYFPPEKAANVLRGALGRLLNLQNPPSALSARPSGLADPPRPFVFRAAHLNGKRFEPGETFGLDVHVFDGSGDWLDTLAGAFSQWEHTGLGPRRGRVAMLLPDAGEEPDAGEQVCLDLKSGLRASRCSLVFRTPTELKGNPARDEMPFGILLARVRDRIGTLRALYGEGPLPLDYAAFAARANQVRTVRSELQYREVWRRSSRTGAVHGIGGVTGAVDYEGELGEFLPWLRAAWWTGVGRHTVWGNGVVEIADAE